MSALTVPEEGLRQDQHVRNVWWLSYAMVVGGGFVIAALARRRFNEPYLGVSVAVILLLLTGWLMRPRATLYATLFLTAISDIVTVWWFPFVKNLSSRESISYVADSLTISPLELSLYIGFAVSTVRRYAQYRTILPKGPLTWPIVAFTSFVAYGFARGIMRGADLRIAVLEGRALFYVLLTFVIIVNECTEARHLRIALWSVLAGVVVQSLLSIQFISQLTDADRDALESLNEHGSALGQNLLIVTLLALVLFGVRAPLLKWLLFAGVVPTIYVYFVSQRRAGIAALLVAGVVMSVALYWKRRRAFWFVTPVVAILFVGYLGAFWNSESSVAFPAQAVKSMIAPEQASAEDQSSNLYRLIEAYDLNYTIKANPIAGLGFGQAFYRPVPLADISAFELNPYVPHNSILWFWIKSGFGGFVAMFFLFAKSLMWGAERVRTASSDLDSAVSLAAVSFIVMYVVFSYVDVSWDARNTAFLGLAFATIASRAQVGVEGTRRQ